MNTTTSNVNNNNNKQNKRQQLLEYAEWQKVDDRYVVYQRALDSDEKDFSFDYFVADLQTHEISDMAGPYNHTGRERAVDLDDEENICITCKACHGRCYSYGCACRLLRKPKTGVSQQELDAMQKREEQDPKFDLKRIDQYYENSLPELCPHANSITYCLEAKAG